jgi:hypothetical protein
MTNLWSGCFSLPSIIVKVLGKQPSLYIIPDHFDSLLLSWNCFCKRFHKKALRPSIVTCDGWVQCVTVGTLRVLHRSREIANSLLCWLKKGKLMGNKAKREGLDGRKVFLASLKLHCYSGLSPESTTERAVCWAGKPTTQLGQRPSHSQPSADWCVKYQLISPETGRFSVQKARINNQLRKFLTATQTLQ